MSETTTEAAESKREELWTSLGLYVTGAGDKRQAWRSAAGEVYLYALGRRSARPAGYIYRVTVDDELRTYGQPEWTGRAVEDRRDLELVAKAHEDKAGRLAAERNARRRPDFLRLIEQVENYAAGLRDVGAREQLERELKRAVWRR